MSLVASVRDHERRLLEIDRSTAGLRDDYKTRNDLIRQESKRYETYDAVEYRPRRRVLQKECDGTSD